MEFVVFRKCEICKDPSDTFCVSCNKFFCLVHLSKCVQCEQPVCKECYKEDLCCLVRPWGEKTQLHLKDFYQNKLIDKFYMRSLVFDVDYGLEYRKEALKRTITHHVDNFDASSLMWCKKEDIRDNFPSIANYIENEESRAKFLSFMYEIQPGFLEYIFLNDNVREDLLSVMDESIRSSENMRSTLISFAMKSRPLFRCMKKRGLLDWKFVDLSFYDTNHLDAIKWIEQQGIDFVNDEDRFEQFISLSSSEILEYLIVEKGMTVEYVSKNVFAVKNVNMIYRIKGKEGIERIAPDKIVFDFETVKFLKSIGYNFNQKRNLNAGWLMYYLVCCKIWKIEDFNNMQKEKFQTYIKNNDIKAVKHLYPFMKEIRKKKILTVILCIRKTCILQKEIVWKIIDLAYSPINERGSL